MSMWPLNNAEKGRFLHTICPKKWRKRRLRVFLDMFFHPKRGRKRHLKSIEPRTNRRKRLKAEKKGEGAIHILRLIYPTNEKEAEP